MTVGAKQQPLNSTEKKKNFNFKKNQIARAIQARPSLLLPLWPSTNPWRVYVLTLLISRVNVNSLKAKPSVLSENTDEIQKGRQYKNQQAATPSTPYPNHPIKPENLSKPFGVGKKCLFVKNINRFGIDFKILKTPPVSHARHWLILLLNRFEYRFKINACVLLSFFSVL